MTRTYDPRNVKIRCTFFKLKILLLLKAKKDLERKKKRTAKYWVHPMLKLRNEIGYYQIFIPVIRSFPDMFEKQFHLPIFVVDLIIENVTETLSRKSHRALSPDFKVYLYLRYLGGERTTPLALSFLIGESTVRRYVNEVADAILTNLAAEFIPIPKTTDDWLAIAEEFEKKRNFPHVLGAIDGKQFRIKKPDNSGTQFFNYKKFFSIGMLAIVDADYRFLYCQVGSYGAESDGGVYRQSDFYKWLNEGLLNIPEPTDIRGFGKIPYFLIGDAAFALSENMLRPYPGTLLPEDKQYFNMRHSSARMAVEQTFGGLVGKFLLMDQPIYAEPEQAEKQILSAAVCWNIFRTYDPTSGPNYGHNFGEFNPDAAPVSNYRDVLKDILAF